jgi:hypothetical protein
VAERWQSSEARTAGCFFRDSTGAPVTGLTPTAAAAHKDGTAGAPAVAVAEVSLGFYRLTFASAPTKDVLVRVDGGATLTATRYAALEVPVGGYVDSLDTTVSSRAAAAAVAALGSPAQASDTATLLGRLSSTRAGLLDNLDAAVSSRATHAEATADTSGTTTLLARLTGTRAALLDALSLLDVAVSSRATHLEATGDSAGVTTLLDRLTGPRAGLLDHLDADVSSRATAADAATLLARLTVARAAALDLLDVAVSTRASSAAVTSLGSPAQFDDARLAHLDADVSSRSTAAAVTSLAAAVAALGAPAQQLFLEAALLALSTAVGQPVQVGDARLAWLDVAVSTRATPADVMVLAPPTGTVS